MQKRALYSTVEIMPINLMAIKERITLRITISTAIDDIMLHILKLIIWNQKVRIAEHICSLRLKLKVIYFFIFKNIHELIEKFYDLNVN